MAAWNILIWMYVDMYNYVYICGMLSVTDLQVGLYMEIYCAFLVMAHLNSLFGL